MLMHVHSRWGTANALCRCRDLSNAYLARCAHLRSAQRIPCPRAAQAICGNGQHRRIAGLERNWSCDGLLIIVLGSRAERLDGAHIDRYSVAWRKDNACRHGKVYRLATTAAATRQRGDQDQVNNDCKRKKNRPTHSSSPPHRGFGGEYCFVWKFSV